MYNKNELKNLIYIQDNKPCNEQTIKGLFRSIVEPILENTVENVVLCRLEEKSQKDFISVLKRLEYSASKVYDFSSQPIGNSFENVLKEEIWDKTEFIYILSERYGAVMIFDYAEAEVQGHASIYLLYNSKNLTEAFDVIAANSKVDLSEYQTKWHPDRRDNETLNSSIRKIVESLNETNQEILISEMEKEQQQHVDETASKLDFILTKSSFIAHEMRNLLSICNLYSNIIAKQYDRISFANEEVKKSIENARNCIEKSLKMAGNLILDFKSIKGASLREHSLKNVIENAFELGKIYAQDKNIEFKLNTPTDATILIDEEKFLAVVINLIKNAVESFEEIEKDSKTVEVKTEVEENEVRIKISNNAKPINEEVKKRLFETNYTTKASGSGLGLIICKKNLEEQFAQLKLNKSDEISTEFEINLPRIS